MTLEFGCVVEGQGDVAAVPILVRRIVERIDPTLSVNTPQPVRVDRGRIGRAGELERAVSLALGRVRDGGALLILLDSDDDCPVTLASELASRVRVLGRSSPFAVVAAQCEFEAWFLAAAVSLRGKRGLDPQLTPPPNPEAIRGAKEWIRARMPPNRRYSETTDQAALAAAMDLDAARTARSFDKFFRDVESLVLRSRSG